MSCRCSTNSSALLYKQLRSKLAPHAVCSSSECYRWLAGSYLMSVQFGNTIASLCSATVKSSGKLIELWQRRQQCCCCCCRYQQAAGLRVADSWTACSNPKAVLCDYMLTPYILQLHAASASAAARLLP
jgi:hypothetical protein